MAGIRVENATSINAVEEKFFPVRARESRRSRIFARVMHPKKASDSEYERKESLIDHDHTAKMYL